MDNQLALFTGASVQAPETVVQTAFDWDKTVAEIKALIEEDNVLGKQEDQIRERRYEIRVQIGFRLIALQQEHANRKNGDFIAFAEREFGYKSRNTVYDHIHVAERLGNYNVLHGGHYNWKSAVELARPSTSNIIIEQVLEGNIEANPDAIKQARKEEAEAKRRAVELAKEKGDLQRDFDIFKQDTELREQTREQVYAAAKRENERLKQEKDQLEQQNKDLREKTIPLLTQQVKDLKEEIASIPMSPQTKEQIEKLQATLVTREADLKKRTEQWKNQTGQIQRLGKELDEQRDANKARHEQEMYEFRVNNRIEKICEEVGKCMVSFLGQLPSPKESEAVSADNWSLIDHVDEMAHRVAEAIVQVRTNRTSRIIEAD